MMAREEVSPEWRHEYPWGRKHPEKRLQELGARREFVLRKRKLLEDRFRERLIDFERMLAAIDGEVQIAEKCREDSKRREIKAVAHRLLTLGVDVFEDIESRAETDGLLDELLQREKDLKLTAKHQGMESFPDQDDEIDGMISDDDIRGVLETRE